MLQQELRRIKARPPLFSFGLWMFGPALLEFGNEEQKKRFIPDIVKGKTRWCQGYSEPGAGSDLAGLQTKCEDKGDHWLINGQKVWTSSAHLSEIGEIICRTDPDQPKHRGMTVFVVDMKAPGVTIRPLRQMTGGANFNEVFFDDVRIPASLRTGRPMLTRPPKIPMHRSRSATRSAMARAFRLAVAVMQPGDTMLGMDLTHGGHLTHGHPLNLSGILYNIVPYGVSREEETIDYEALEALAEEHRPKLIVCGASAYPRQIDFERLRTIADQADALLLADIAHIAGLVAYCNAPLGAKLPKGMPDWPAVRAKNGHPEPYNVRIWEIGNEVHGDWQVGWTTAGGYVDRYRRFARAIQAVDLAPGQSYTVDTGHMVGWEEGVGYEVQKVLVAVDWFEARHGSARIGVVGFAEGRDFNTVRGGAF